MPQPDSNRHRRPGFTLTEMLVTVVIMAVVATVAMPRLSRQMVTNKADAAAYVVASDLEMAFTLATRQRRPVTFTVDPSNRRTIIRDRASSTILMDRYLSDRDSPWGITGLSMNVGAVTIFPNGLAGQSATVSVAVRNQVRAVNVTRTGLVRISVP